MLSACAPPDPENDTNWRRVVKDKPGWWDRLSNRISEMGLTIHDFNILTTIYYSSCSRKELVDRTMRRSREASKRGVLAYSNRSNCGISIDILTHNNIIAVTNKNIIEYIVNHLINHPAYGPLDGLPDHDSIDFTLNGASLWEELSRSAGHGNSITYESECYSDYALRYRCCCTTKKAVTEKVEARSTTRGGQSICRLISVGGPRYVGPWRDRWWRDAIRRGYEVNALFQIDQITTN